MRGRRAVRRSAGLHASRTRLKTTSFQFFWLLAHATARSMAARRSHRGLCRARGPAFRIESAKICSTASSSRSASSHPPIGAAGRIPAPGSVVRRSADDSSTGFSSCSSRIAPTGAARSADLRRSLCGDDALPDRALQDSAAPIGLWESLAAITRLSRSGCRVDDLIVRPFNGRLFARSAAPSLEAAGLPAG